MKPKAPGTGNITTKCAFIPQFALGSSLAMVANKTTRFQFLDTPTDVAEHMLEHPDVIEYIYAPDPEDPDYATGYFRTRIPRRPSWWKSNYDGSFVHTNIYANYRDIVEQARLDFGEAAIEKVGKRPTYEFTKEQRQRGAASTAKYWDKVKEACLNGQVAWIQETYPKFWETRQDCIQKWLKK